MDSTTIKTRFLILSDTHGANLPPEYLRPADVVIHCGDLTAESKLSEFKAVIHLLERINAPLKLVIAGNHDFTLDTPLFRKKVAEASFPLDTTLLRMEYGDYGEPRRLLKNSKLKLLDEGTHHFTLKNGASLTVYASPYTPSLGCWGFQYRPQDGHDFSIPSKVDVVVTHGPPKGVMDYAKSGQRAGCPGLFSAVARARPRMHCFGHIHEGWGAKLVTWRGKASESPSHLTDIDSGRSVKIRRLSDMAAEDLQGCCSTSHCTGDRHPLRRGIQTLFVNAAVEGVDGSRQSPWVVDLELPRAL